MPPFDAVLIYPPFLHYFAGPPLGIASLQAAAKAAGFTSAAWDINAEFMRWLLEDPEELEHVAERLERRASSLWQSPSRDFFEDLSLFTAVDGLHCFLPVLRHALHNESIAGKTTIVGDHDKSEALSLALRLVAIDVFDEGHSFRPELADAELTPERAVELARSTSFGCFGDYVRRVLVPRLERMQPRLVGFSLLSATQVMPALHIAAQVRRFLPESFVVFGGSHITASIDKLDQLAPCAELIDAFAVYEGETLLPRLLEELRGRRPRLDELPNIASTEGGHPQWDRNLCVEDIEELPVPDFSTVDLDSYYRPRSELPFPLITSKGCVYGRCKFCTYVYQEPVGREQSPTKVVGQMQALQEAHGARVFSLKDSLMTTLRARKLSEAFLAAGLDIRWNCQSKVSLGFTPELIEQMDESGCRTIEFGVETPNPRLQKLIVKVAPLDTIERMLERFGGTSIAIIFNMIYGFPSETKEEAEESLAWVSKLGQRFPDVAFSSVNHMLTIARGSPFHSDPDRFGIDVVGEWPLSAQSEWVTPAWHREFRRRIANVLHRGGTEQGGIGQLEIMRRELKEQLGRRDREWLELGWRLVDAEEEVEKMRIERRLLRFEAMSESARIWGSRPPASRMPPPFGEASANGFAVEEQR